MNTSPLINDNGIQRAYAVTTFHAAPKRILIIGVSGGAWTRVLSQMPSVQQIVAVEINKGYHQLIAQHTPYKDILNDARIQWVIDDGRRWIKNNPDEKFDLIVMNTIYHWRSNATNLLSQEFFEMCKNRLNTGGYIYVNNTGAREVGYTAAHVFNFVHEAFDKRMVIAGDTPPSLSQEQRQHNLLAFLGDFGEASSHTDWYRTIVNSSYPNQRESILQQSTLRLITDDNMATEFRRLFLVNKFYQNPTHIDPTIILH